MCDFFLIFMDTKPFDATDLLITEALKPAGSLFEEKKSKILT